MIVNIAETLTKIAAEQPDKVGLIEAKTGKTQTFKELDQKAQCYASYLQGEGIDPGARVMLMVRPSADFISLSFALFRIGAPVILIDPGMGYKNLLKCIAAVRPDYLIGIPKAILFSILFKKIFQTLQKSFCCGTLIGIKRDFRKNALKSKAQQTIFQPDATSLAAIIFTTGSTGPPKGVRFEHSIFAAQLHLIKNYFNIGQNDTDLPGFPLFGLFSIALGACAVIPDMDPTRPAQVNPEKFVHAIRDYGVTYSFGSPAIWNVVSNFCLKKNIRCQTLKKVLMAGAPVSGNLVRQVFKSIAPDGQIFTPYGATECLPIVVIEGHELIGDLWEKTRDGKGVCVGRPLPGIKVKVIEPSDKNFNDISYCTACAPFEIGEIIVSGNVVTRGYENNDEENRFSKIPDNDSFWHRIGDVGYFDNEKRLWFCGRKAHRVFTEQGVMYTIPCEAISNEHPDVYRSALVGIPRDNGFQEPVIIIEIKKDSTRNKEHILAEVRELCSLHTETEKIKFFLVHPHFPVDIRHNAKIFREKLQLWAQEQQRGHR